MRVAHALTATTITWGTFAFGAVYPWAFWPLAVLAFAAGLAGLVAAFPERKEVTTPISKGLAWSMVALVSATLVQLIPVSPKILRAFNPHGVELLRQWDLAFAHDSGSHALSMAPAATWVAVVLLVSFSVLLVGTANVASITGPRRLIGTLTVIGIVMALVGIIQKPLSTLRIYGFWTPQEGGNPFGPFVNPNHFAAWTLMVLPLALGYVCSVVARTGRGAPGAWRNRIVWLATRDANRLILAAMGIVIMGLALVLTLSRSGISALAVALFVMAWTAVRNQQGRARKLFTAGYFVLLATMLVGWVGADLVLNRFRQADWGSLNGRRHLWVDASDTFLRHWLTGTGLNTYQFAQLFYQTRNIAVSYESSAHNDYLQIAAEGGLLLIIPATICIAVVIREIHQRLQEDESSSAYWVRTGAVTALVAVMLQETVDFSLQIPGNAALFAVVCGLALHRPQRTRGSSRHCARSSSLVGPGIPRALHMDCARTP